MKIVFTGAGGKAGSWKMRAEQLAATRPDWRAIPKAVQKDFQGADAVVFVKRIPESTLQEAKRWGGPIIWDCLDFWKQPKESHGINSVESARSYFSNYFNYIDADIILVPNSLMKKDITPLCRRVDVFPHHFDPILVPQQKHAGEITYWGHPRYLDKWEKIMKEICLKLGFQFLINPKNPATCQAMFAIRAGLYGSWLDRRWKSSVKGATAMALGVPLIAYPETSLLEFCSSHLWTFTNEYQLEESLITAINAAHLLKSNNIYSVERSARLLENILEA